MLLSCCFIHKHHHIETLFIFTIFVSPSKPRSIYVIYMIYFSFSPPFSIWKQTHLLFYLFLRMCLILFKWKRGWRMQKNFSKRKSSTSGYCLAFAWFFCQFQHSVAYIKKAFIFTHMFPKYFLHWSLIFFGMFNINHGVSI